MVLGKLREHNLYAKKSKCFFGRTRLEFLGFNVEDGRISVTDDTIKAVKELAPPKNASDVRRFLGLVNTCRRFIPNYATIVAPLCELTGSKEWTWGKKQKEAWLAAKRALYEATPLNLPNLADETPFKVIVHSDASGVAIGATLSQVDLNGNERIIAYVSRKLSEPEKKYKVHELEALAIVYALSQWRCYLEGLRTEVYTDHNPLKYLKTQPELSRQQARWMEYIERFDIVIKYKPGKENEAADCLSRPPENDVPVPDGNADDDLSPEELPKLNALIGENTPYDSDWPQYVLEYRQSDLPEDFPERLRALLERDNDKLIWNEDEGILNYQLSDEKSVPYVPLVKRADLIQQTHEGSGHLSHVDVLNLLKDRCWWPSMKTDIKEWLKYCHHCQLHANQDHIRHEEAHPMQPPLKPFIRWSIDVVGPLPKTPRGNEYAIVAIEHATRWVVAGAYPTFDAKTTANFIYRKITVNYGCPHELLSDRGPNFMAETLQQYLHLCQMKHSKSTPYHPRTNGMVEKVNGQLQDQIMAACGGARNEWDLFLDQALLNLRTRVHQTTGFSPFKLMFGVEPKLPGDPTPPHVFESPSEQLQAEYRNRLFLNESVCPPRRFVRIPA
jgi:hypothetical protein